MPKTSGNEFLGSLEEVFHIFSILHSTWRVRPIPFRIFVDHGTIFSLSPMQYLIGNNWELMLILVMESFVLKVTGLDLI